MTAALPAIEAAMSTGRWGVELAAAIELAQSAGRLVAARRRDGPATCRVWDPAYLGSPPVETYVRTPPIPAGGTLTFEQRVADLGTEARAFAVDCSR